MPIDQNSSEKFFCVVKGGQLSAESKYLCDA